MDERGSDDAHGDRERLRLRKHRAWRQRGAHVQQPWNLQLPVLDSLVDDRDDSSLRGTRVVAATATAATATAGRQCDDREVDGNDRSWCDDHHHSRWWFDNDD